MLVIRGSNSLIAQELERLLPKGEQVIRAPRQIPMPLDADRYFICQGVITPKMLIHQGEPMLAKTFRVNFWGIAEACDRIFAANDRARICVIGSESAYTGSFDGAYSASKAALHSYVETKKLRTSMQQLTCVSPTIIRVSGMTLARDDLEEVDRRAREHPKKRWLTALEVAKAAHFLLYVDEGYTTGMILRMNGGAHA